MDGGDSQALGEIHEVGDLEVGREADSLVRLDLHVGDGEGTRGGVEHNSAACRVGEPPQQVGHGGVFDGAMRAGQQHDERFGDLDQRGVEQHVQLRAVVIQFGAESQRDVRCALQEMALAVKGGGEVQQRAFCHDAERQERCGEGDFEIGWSKMGRIGISLGSRMR